MKALFLVSLFFIQVSQAAVDFNLQPKEGKIEFLAIGNPGFLKINGHGEGPKGSIHIAENNISGELAIDISTLDSGMSLRNKHMKEKYLEMDKFPQAKLIIKDQPLPNGWTPENKVVSSARLKAELEMHGERQPVDVDYRIDKDFRISANFKIKITDYKVAIPSFMGVTVTEVIELKVDTLVKEIKKI